MQVTILGTSAMVPTITRTHSAIFLSFGSEGILFDCGEGTQRQLKLASIKLTKVTKIFISHWHGDHTLGIPGLMQSLASEDYSKTLQIYGPKGTADKLKMLDKIYPSNDTFEYKVHEISSGTIVNDETYSIHAKPIEHNTPCFGYSFIEKDRRRMKISKLKELRIPEGPLLGKLQKGKSVKHNNKTINPDDVTFIVKGKKVTYISDTKLCKNAIDLAKDSDLLIAESTYALNEKEKAANYNHMTSSDAARIAADSSSKRLILTHISQRYKDTDQLCSTFCLSFC